MNQDFLDNTKSTITATALTVLALASYPAVPTGIISESVRTFVRNTTPYDSLISKDYVGITNTYPSIPLEAYNSYIEADILTILEFANKLVSKSENLSSDIVALVDENFWDLLV